MNPLKLKFYATAGIIAALVAGSFYTGGYFIGVRTERLENEQARNKELLDAVTYVRKFEQTLAKESNNASSEYEKQLAIIRANANAASAELGRLRVKARTCSVGVPTGNDAGKSKTTAEGSTYGLATGEINLDDVAAEIIRLGNDLDEANANIIALQVQADICEKATAPKRE